MKCGRICRAISPHTGPRRAGPGRGPPGEVSSHHRDCVGHRRDGRALPPGLLASLAPIDADAAVTAVVQADDSVTAAVLVTGMGPSCRGSRTGPGPARATARHREPAIRERKATESWRCPALVRRGQRSAPGVGQQADLAGQATPGPAQRLPVLVIRLTPWGGPAGSARPARVGPGPHPRAAGAAPRPRAGAPAPPRHRPRPSRLQSLAALPGSGVPDR